MTDYRNFSPRISYQRQVERVSQAVVRVHVLDVAACFISIRNIILEWLEEKAGRTLTAAMREGLTDSLDSIGAQRVETVALSDPILWAARQDYLDPKVTRRTWVTEAMLAVDGRQTLLLGFRLHCVTLGDPEPFSRTIPRFMREVARKFDVFLDNVEIALDATLVESEDEIEALVQNITDTRRRMPIVGISKIEMSHGDIQPLIDANKLASGVFSAAHVYVLSKSASFGLTDKIGKRLSVYNGAVRIWWAPLNLERGDPYDHPLFLNDRILEEGESGTRAKIIDAVLRASAGRRDADEAIPSFAEARRIASTVLRENARGEGKSTDEIIELYESENRRLLEEIRETKNETDNFLSLADKELQTLALDRDEARAQIHTLQQRLTEMMNALRKRDEQPIIDIPDNFDVLPAWSEMHLEGFVELLPRALNAAKKSMLQNPSLAYEALLLIRDTYVPMRRGGSSALKERWEVGLRQLGLDCQPTFSGTRAGEFANDYIVFYRGRRTEIDMHLKGSSSRDPRYCFRIYFFWCEEVQKVIVAWLPSHLNSRIT